MSFRCHYVDYNEHTYQEKTPRQDANDSLIRQLDVPEKINNQLRGTV